MLSLRVESGLLKLSYKSLVVLWTAHTPALQQEVCVVAILAYQSYMCFSFLQLVDMAKTCMTLSSEKAFLTYISGRDLVRSC